MPRKRKGEYPSLRRHKARGLGVVTLSGEYHYLGRWPDGLEQPPAGVRAAYDRAVAEWLQRGRRPWVPARGAAEADAAPSPLPPQSLSLAVLFARWWRWAESHYAHPDGSPTGELDNCRLALRAANHLYGGTAAAEFGPLKLKAVREVMVTGYRHPRHGRQGPLSRKTVNARCRRIVRVFKWAVAEELVVPAVHLGLAAVPGLAVDRGGAREKGPVRPVAEGDVERTLPGLQPSAAGLVRLQLFTGMRPGEAWRARLVDLDRGGPVWLYRPGRHKTAYRGGRVIALGPKAQAVVNEFLRVRCPLCGVKGRPPRIGCRDGALCGPCADRMDEAGVAGPWPGPRRKTPRPLCSPRRVTARSGSPTSAPPGSRRCNRARFVGRRRGRPASPGRAGTATRSRRPSPAPARRRGRPLAPQPAAA